MMNRRRLLLGLLAPIVVLLIGACASTPTLTPELADPSNNANFPRDRYITGVGISSEGPNQAELDAKRKVAEQIRSDLESVLIDEQGALIKDNRLHEYQVLVSKVKTTARFEHAEMLRVDTSYAQQTGGLFYAFAYLPRQEAYIVLATEYETSAVVFRRSASNALNAGFDLTAFTAAHRYAEEAYAKLWAKNLEIRAVARAPHESFAQDLATYRQLEDARVKALGQLRMTVVVNGLTEPGERELVWMAIVGALTQHMHLSATGEACGPQKYKLEINASVNCGRSAFGPVCTLNMNGALSHCLSGQVLTELNLDDSYFRAINTRDERKAREALFQKVNVETLLPLLQKSLSVVLPIEAKNGPAADTKEP